MTQPRKASQNKKRKQAAIFDAACRVIRKSGFHQARMADIANEAGISYGLVYHYFNSKAELLEALINEWWDGLNATIDEQMNNKAPVEERLCAIINYFLDQYETRPELVHVFITEFSRSSSNLTQENLKRFKSLMNRTGLMIAQAQEEGAIRKDLKASYLTYTFLGSIEALLSSMVLEDQHLKGEAQKQRLAKALLTMFCEGAYARRS